MKNKLVKLNTMCNLWKKLKKTNPTSIDIAPLEESIKTLVDVLLKDKVYESKDAIKAALKELNAKPKKNALTKVCSRCGGSGVYLDMGYCFGCNGSGIQQTAHAKRLQCWKEDIAFYTNQNEQGSDYHTKQYELAIALAKKNIESTNHVGLKEKYQRDLDLAEKNFQGHKDRIAKFNEDYAKYGDKVPKGYKLPPIF